MRVCCTSAGNHPGVLLTPRTTPELNGEVIRVAADISQDPTTGAAFYTVRVNLPDHEMARLGSLKVVVRVGG